VLFRSRFNADDDEIFNAVVEQFNKVCVSYMDTHEGIRKAAFIEMVCFMQIALIDHQTKGEDLKERIEKIIDAAVNTQ
jgi:hypothetical protein